MMKESKATAESGYDKEVETLYSKGNQSLSQVVQSGGKAAHGKIPGRKQGRDETVL